MSDHRSVRFFTFRKRDRDAAGDERRVALVRGAIRSALSSTEVERGGLARRVEDLRGWVGDLMGDGCGGFEQRDAEDERELATAERLLLAGSVRLARLDNLDALFRAMDRLLDADGTDPEARKGCRRALQATA